MASPQGINVSEIGLTVLNPELSTDQIVVDIVFVHGLGGHARETWTYQGPERDPVSLVPQRAVRPSSTMEEQGANVADAVEPHPVTTTTVAQQNDAQLAQEGHADPIEPAGTSFRKFTKISFRHLLSSSSRSKGKAKEQTRKKVSSEVHATQVAANKHVFFWPQRLPEVCARARVMTFGYDSDISKFFGGAANKNNFYDHAGDLLGALVRKRTNALDRPIIFVAHSLGGLVVKQMLFDADRSEALPENQKVYSSTTALFFLGTPHRGSDWAGWGEIARGLASVFIDTNPSLIKNLKVNNDHLMQLEKNFGLLVYRRTFWVYTFTEAKGFKPLPFLNSKIVNENYATVGDYARERIFTLNANHTAICRFWGKTDPGFEIVAGELSMFVEQNIVQASAQVNQIEDSEAKSGKEALLESLHYEGRRDREDNLWKNRADGQTVQWIWDSSFDGWTSEHGGIFWICGKPASGKSTLMEHIARDPQLQASLSRSINDRWTVIHHFFFEFSSNDDKDLRNNFEGFLRSLLYQLTENLKAVNLPGIEPKHGWSLRALEEGLFDILKQHPSPIFMLLDGLDEYQGDKWELARFLRDMANPRVKLCVASRPNPVFNSTFVQIPTIKMQEWNVSAIDKMVTLTISRDMTASGFYNYEEVVELAQGISKKAQGVFLWARFAIDELRDGWSKRLEVEELQKRLENVPEKLEDIYARIFRKLKPEERQQAALILRLVLYAKRNLSSRELYVATVYAASGKVSVVKQLSARDIRDFEIRILAVTGGVLDVFPIRKTSNNLEFDGAELQGNQGSDKMFVSVIHKTVRTYLESKHSKDSEDSCGWFQVLGGAHEGVLHAQMLWLRVCAAVFPPSFQEIPPPYGRKSFKQHLNTNNGLLEYAALYMLDHATDVEQGLGLASYETLQSGMSHSFLCYHRFCWKNRLSACTCFRGFPMPSHPLHLAVAHGLDGYVKNFLSNIEKSNRPGSREWNDVFYVEIDDTEGTGSFWMSLLEFAVHHANNKYHVGVSWTRIVALLSDQYSRVHDAEMMLALQRSSVEVVKLLLRHWPDGKMVFKSNIIQLGDYSLRHDISRSDLSPFFQQEFDVCPLWFIARRINSRYQEDHAELFDLFMRRGEDINAQCGPVGTALHSAMFYLARPGTDITMPKLLFASGANINAKGPLGTPLELVWRLANTDTGCKWKYLRRWPHVIQWLIDNGAVNNMSDPNGSVPTREQMLSFGRSGSIEGIRQSQKLYRGEAVEYNNNTAGKKQLLEA